MAQTRLKTVEYAFSQLQGAYTSGTTSYFTPIAVYIPETTSRNFVSVISYVVSMDSGIAAVSPTRRTVSVGIDETAYSTTTITATITNTGEAQTYAYVTDHTQYFRTSFTGSSHTVSGAYMHAPGGYTNVSMKLIITYEWDDSHTTRLKTVRIPISSKNQTLTTSLVEHRVNEVPNLDSWLPEQNKVYRDIFFEISVNDAMTAAVNPDCQLGLALDAEGSSDDALHSDALVTARWFYRIWKRTDMDTSVAHAFKSKTTSATCGFNSMGAMLNVTYEYDASISTSVMNSVMIAMDPPSVIMGSPLKANASVYSKDIPIDEYAPSIRQSALRLFVNDSAAYSIRISTAGALSFSTYSFVNPVASGLISDIIHRIDDNDSNQGFRVRQGTNTFEAVAWSTSATAGSRGTNGSGFLYLNYVSSRSALSGGDATHFHTVITSGPVMGTAAVALYSQSRRLNIPESNYYVVDDGVYLYQYASASYFNLNYSAYTSTTTGVTAGFRRWGDSYIQSENEIGYQPAVYPSRILYKRFPQDIDSTRTKQFTNWTSFELNSITAAYLGGYWFTSYHSSTYTVTGTVSGYDGDGSGITVNAYRIYNGDPVASVTTSAGGTFSFPWYFKEMELYGEAIQTSTKKGRSANIIAGTTAMDISLSAAASGGTRSYPFVQ